jgi:hypothetical protein
LLVEYIPFNFFSMGLRAFFANMRRSTEALTTFRLEGSRS